MSGLDVRNFAESTSVTSAMPWGVYVSARLMCSDGIVRKTVFLSDTADTFFSVPAKIMVGRKVVSGYMTHKCMSGSEVATDDDPLLAVFRHYKRFDDVLPSWTA